MKERAARLGDKSRGFLSADGVAGEFVFRAIRGMVRIVLFRRFDLRHEGAEAIRREGAFILAPVHRSNLDGPLLGGLTHRRVRYLGKESLFKNKPAAWVMTAVGSFPVKRGSADLDAMRAAKGILDNGEAMLVFPEGTRQEGDEIGEIFNGAAWLSGKANVPVVPIGIAGTEEAMPPGVKFPRKVKVGIVVGEAMEPPGQGKPRASRADLREWTDELGVTLSQLQKRARELADS